MAADTYTQSQKNRIAGFRASLAVRGQLLRCDEIGVVFLVLIDERGLESQGFVIEAADQPMAQIHILNTHYKQTEIRFGAILQSTKTRRSYTVTKREDGDIKAILTCTVNP